MRIFPTVLVTTILSTPLLGQSIGGGFVVEDEATLIKQRLGAPVAGDVQFVDDQGENVRIADYLGDKPIILNLQYFSCPSLCGPVFQGLVNAMSSIELTAGKDYKVLSVSFDHREDTELAAYKKKSALEVYGRDGAATGWHFLTSDQESIRKLTESVGYGFRWNTTRNDFDHKAAMIFIAPDGKITRYLRGASYDTRTFRLAIVEAGKGEVGTALDRFILSCYSYDPLSGTYSRIGPNVMAAGGALTLAGLAALLFVLWRREKRQVTPVAAS